MNILVVAAHPDDEIIGMGGALKKLSKTHSISVLFLADGITARKTFGHKNSLNYESSKIEKQKMKQEIEKRKVDAKKALKLVGVSKMKFLDLPDNELDLVPFLKIVKQIETEIKKTKCNIVFTHHHNDLNIDHRIAYEATVTATRPLPNSNISAVFSFEAISSSDWHKPYQFNPQLFIDISKELGIKIKSLQAYKNEIQKFPHPRSKEMIEITAKRWGSLYGFNAAEAFEIIYQRIENFKDFV
jgi:LmbE family N-acetylglucosaminyl deacetylase